MTAARNMSMPEIRRHLAEALEASVADQYDAFVERIAAFWTNRAAEIAAHIEPGVSLYEHLRREKMEGYAELRGMFDEPKDRGGIVMLKPNFKFVAEAMAKEQADAAKLEFIAKNVMKLENIIYNKSLYGVEGIEDEFEYPRGSYRIEGLANRHQAQAGDDPMSKKCGPPKHLPRASDVDPQQLRWGIAAELEHTCDRERAKTIALEHLVEHPKYYSYLRAAERRMKRGLAPNPTTGHGREVAALKISREANFSDLARPNDVQREGMIRRHEAAASAYLDATEAYIADGDDCGAAWMLEKARYHERVARTLQSGAAFQLRDLHTMSEHLYVDMMERRPTAAYSQWKEARR